MLFGKLFYSTAAKVPRTITNNNYIVHTEPLFKELKLVKMTDMYMYVTATWKFYHKLMNNQLPMFFSSMTSPLSVACAHYQLKNPMTYLPTIKHTYAKYSMQISDNRWHVGAPSCFVFDACRGVLSK